MPDPIVIMTAKIPKIDKISEPFFITSNVKYSACYCQPCFTVIRADNKLRLCLGLARLKTDLWSS